MGGKDKDFQTWNLPRQLALARDSRVYTLAAPYMSLGTCIAGANLIVQRLFGISFEVAEPRPGEVWHDSVRKLRVMDADGTELGTLYCDLFRRSNKNNHASHYTLQSGRARGSDNSGPQRPIVALVCGFREPRGSQPVLLSYHEANTLFHELGHAMHSVLSETEYQNVSGTRGSLDFGELPSSFFEWFLLDDRILPLFARHYETGQPMPVELARGLRHEATRFVAFDMESSLMLSAMDQHYHSADYVTSQASLFEGLQSVQEKFGVFPFDRATRFTRFTHLLGYGANYYSYLWCQGLASLIWKHCFQDAPLDSNAGHSLRHKILAHGSGSEPWGMVQNMLGWQPSATDVAEALLRDATSSVSTTASPATASTTSATTGRGHA